LKEISHTVDPKEQSPAVTDPKNLEARSIPMLRSRTILWYFALLILLPLGVGWTQTDGSHQKAAVIIDHSNKQNIRGNISIAYAWGDHFTPPEQLLRGIINLKEAMNRWTKIETGMESHLFLGTPRLLDMAFVYVTTENSFDLSETEKANVKKYLLNGGFMVIENPRPQTEAGPAEAALKQMIRDALGSQARFQPIPISHPIYHSFFDFTDGPPYGSEIPPIPLATTGEGPKISSFLTKPVFYLEGVWIDERLVVVFSNKGYIAKWIDMQGNIPQLKMGVNLIVFALTQVGGIASRN
jgi:hypothetical protein